MAREPRGHDWDGRAWLSDAALSRCSFDARAIWADMISLMMLSPQIGRLVGSDGTPWSDEDIAAAVRGDKPALRDALAEILRKGVASRDAANVVYCRRIVRREHEKRALRKRVGRSRFKHENAAAPSGDAACNGDVTPGGLGAFFDLFRRFVSSARSNSDFEVRMPRASRQRVVELQAPEASELQAGLIGSSAAKT
jgi:hypothetical protein